MLSKITQRLEAHWKEIFSPPDALLSTVNLGRTLYEYLPPRVVTKRPSIPLTGELHRQVSKDA